MKRANGEGWKEGSYDSKITIVLFPLMTGNCVWPGGWMEWRVAWTSAGGETTADGHLVKSLAFEGVECKDSEALLQVWPADCIDWLADESRRLEEAYFVKRRCLRQAS